MNDPVRDYLKRQGYAGYIVEGGVEYLLTTWESTVSSIVAGDLVDYNSYLKSMDRRRILEERGRELQRLQKLLEDAQVKLDSVVSDINGVSSRLILDALCEGDAERLAHFGGDFVQPLYPGDELRVGVWHGEDDTARLRATARGEEIFVGSAAVGPCARS